jgi:hypothetical protein
MAIYINGVLIFLKAILDLMLLILFHGETLNIYQFIVHFSSEVVLNHSDHFRYFQTTGT